MADSNDLTKPVVTTPYADVWDTSKSNNLSALKMDGAIGKLGRVQGVRAITKPSVGNIAVTELDAALTTQTIFNSENLLSKTATTAQTVASPLTFTSTLNVVGAITGSINGNTTLCGKSTSIQGLALNTLTAPGVYSYAHGNAANTDAPTGYRSIAYGQFKETNDLGANFGLQEIIGDASGGSIGKRVYRCVSNPGTNNFLSAEWIQQYTSKGRNIESGLTDDGVTALQVSSLSAGSFKILGVGGFYGTFQSVGSGGDAMAFSRKAADGGGFYGYIGADNSLLLSPNPTASSRITVRGDTGVVLSVGGAAPLVADSTGVSVTSIRATAQPAAYFSLVNNTGSSAFGATVSSISGISAAGANFTVNKTGRYLLSMGEVEANFSPFDAGFFKLVMQVNVNGLPKTFIRVLGDGSMCVATGWSYALSLLAGDFVTLVKVDPTSDVVSQASSLIQIN